MYTSALIKCRWADDENQIVHITETINGVSTITAEVTLHDDNVTIIHIESVDASYNPSPDNNRILHAARAWARRQRPLYPKDIRWHEDGMKFETYRESWEWAYSVVYNEIGNIYDGYRTEDEKIACSLVYELTRLNTFQGLTFQVFAHREYEKAEQKLWYTVWVNRV